MFPADRIRLLRQSRGLTQAQLARALALDRTTLTKYETGERLPDMRHLCAVADFFRVSTEYLMGRESAPELARILEGELLLDGVLLTPAQKKTILAAARDVQGESHE